MINKTALVLYSGGKGSFLSAYLAKNLYRDTLLYFNDTKTEDEDLYRFLNETVAWLNLELVCDSDGRDIWQLFKDQRYVANTRVDLCSRVLKRERSHQWVRENYPDPTAVDVVVGLGLFEEHRIAKAAPHWKPYQLVSLLSDASVDEQRLWHDLSLESGIAEPRLYGLGFPHNNCGGFCVKAGLAQFKMLYEKLPERYAFHEAKQEALSAEIPRVRPFLRKTIDGRVNYLTLREYRERYLESPVSAPDPDETYDFGGCGCAI